jgi:hypothetical protein
MKRTVAFGLLAVLLGSASGCGGQDALIREALLNLNAYADTIERKEPPERQQAALERFRSTEEKINKLPADKKELLLKRYEPELNRVKERIDAALKNQILEGGALTPNPLDSFLK